MRGYKLERRIKFSLHFFKSFRYLLEHCFFLGDNNEEIGQPQDDQRRN